MQIDKKKHYLWVCICFYFISFKVPINQATTNHLIYHIFLLDADADAFLE
jgi:hypothetical protein